MYFVLLLLTAIIAYFFGSLDTMTIASLYIFRKNLRKLGRGNVWLSNFRRIYGFFGLLKLLAVELVKDIIPIILGGLFLSGKGHADVGRVFAAFCLILGRQWPLFYDFKGSCATVCIIVAGFFTGEASIGAAALVAGAAVTWLSKYYSAGAFAAAAVMAITALLLVEQKLIIYLLFFILVISFIRNIPSFIRILKGTETKLSLKKDLSYKLDE